MIKNLRRRLARWRSTPAGWIWPLAVVATIAAAALAFRWWRALPPTPPTVSYSVFLERLQQGAVGVHHRDSRAPKCAASGPGPVGDARGRRRASAWTIPPSR